MVMEAKDAVDWPEIRSSYKRPFDLTVLIMAHLAFLPLWLLLWTMIPLAIWIGDRGPIFYRQERTGKDSRVFTIVKFRTMVPDAHLKGPAWTMQGDVRLTRVGKFLRRTALDELPGLWSIMKGDMSLVGPRPPLPEEVEEFETWHLGKLAVTPGITCYWQINGRSDIHDFNKWIRLDLKYIEEWSLWTDVKILARTVPVVLRGHGAY